MQPNAVCKVVFAGMLMAHGSAQSAAVQSAPQSNDPKAIASDVLKQSGLRLPEGVSDLLEFAAKQGAQTDCESINVEWTSLPESKEFAPEVDTDGPDFPETLTIQSRHSFPTCGPQTYRAVPADFPFFGFVVFGVSVDGTIRGLQADSDPRVMIVDCFVVSGPVLPPPPDHCGRFVQRKGTVDIRMPRDPALARLIFYVRKCDSRPGCWHLVRVASIDLPSEAHTKKPAESPNSL
jgi:hypothetical protein